MRRHEIMDLFFGDCNEQVGDWHKIEDGLPQVKSKGTKVRVRLSNQIELFAYFYEDKCKFWDSSSKQLLFNVTHWRAVKEPE